MGTWKENAASQGTVSERPRAAEVLRIREKPICAGEQRCANIVGGRSIRNRFARTTSLGSLVISVQPIMNLVSI
jgi:hypothetical protein